PNGGYGWVIVFMGFSINFVMFGVSSIWGLFAINFASTSLGNRVTIKELMGIGSVGFISLNIFVIFVPVLARHGVRLTMITGSVLLSLGIALSGLATELWQLYLTWGLLFGLGTSLVYTTTVNLVAQWFSTRRATAMGISSCGTGVGGLVFSNLVNFLTVKLGIQWACHICGLITLVVCVSASCLARSCESSTTEKRPVYSSLKWGLLKNTNFIIAIVGLVCSCAAYQMPLYLLPAYCVKHKIDMADAAIAIGVTLASNSFGRIILGLVADRYGRLNTFIITTLLSGLFCSVVWPFAKSFQLVMLFAVLFGLTGSVYYILAAPIIVETVEMADASSAISFLFLFTSIAPIGTLIASVILEHTFEGSYIGAQMLAGALYIISSGLCFFLKMKRTK
ncbi:major facilitator superfamily domain-containing protein, partial [Choanephora cucurbitarum]